MSRIFRIAEMFHQQDSDATIDLVETVAGGILEFLLLMDMLPKLQLVLKLVR